MSPADVLSEPIPFEWHDPKRGRLDLLVSPLTFGMEVAIQRWLEGRARAAVQREREAMSLFDYELNWRGWRQDCATGVYAYGGMACFQAMCTAEGWCYRAWVMLREKSQDVTPEMVERIAADPAKRKELDALIELANDPGRRRPAQAAPPDHSPLKTPSPALPVSPGAVPVTRSGT
jgi:hypothetical protein